MLNSLFAIALGAVVIVVVLFVGQHVLAIELGPRTPIGQSLSIAAKSLSGIFAGAPGRQFASLLGSVVSLGA